MNLERLRWGEWIAAIAALDLLLVTFRGWYKVSGGGGHVTAWDALSQGRYLLIATAVVGIFLWLLQASEDSTRLSFPPGWIAAAIGLACTVYIAYRLATPPVDNYDADLGLYLGLVSALGVAIGGLLSAREPAAATTGRTASDVAQDTFTGPSGAPQEPLGALVPDSGGTWSPAAPTPATTGWSPTGAAAPALTAGGAAAAGERALQPGDHVTLTTGGARFPAGTVAEVVEVFRGGALVEVKAPDGMAERFEVPEAAFDRGAAGAGAAAAAPPLESTSPSIDAPGWEPAMPAAAGAGDDWGFDEEPAAQEPQPEKVPWWKREIGGGKKKGEAAAATAAVASAAGIVAAHEADQADEHANGNGDGAGKPSFFKRLFGGGSKAPADEETTEVPEAEPTPAVATAGMGEAAESDTAVHETAPESVVDDAPAAVAASSVVERDADPTPEEPEAAATVAEPVSAPPEPEPEAAAPEEAPAAPEPEAAAIEEPEAAAAAHEPEVVIDSPSSSDPDTPAADAEPVAAPPEPEPEASEPQVAETPPDPVVEEAPEAAAATAAAPEADDPEAKPKRKRSSGSRKVPREVLVTADDPQPKVGDEVQLKVGGGKFDAGTRGTVVDVFSAGVIVELSAPDGRTERLDLPFEAVGPAEA